MLPEQYAADIARGLAELRLYAEARMSGRCTIHRITGSAVVDGFKVPAWTETHVDLPIRISGAAHGDAPMRVEDIAGLEVALARRVAHLPHDTTDLDDGDHIEVTSGELVGSVFRILESGGQDQATARRLPVVAVARPSEWDEE